MFAIVNICIIYGVIIIMWHEHEHLCVVVMLKNSNIDRIDRKIIVYR